MFHLCLKGDIQTNPGQAWYQERFKITVTQDYQKTTPFFPRSLQTIDLFQGRIKFFRFYMPQLQPQTAHDTNIKIDIGHI